ncbi:hypothetical protein GCM10010983_47720 [Caulobacter rhizosphaerae]|nr:hypothetical protein GCM10010983_47720 [Caulobacter rhizosphaerae]
MAQDLEEMGDLPGPQEAADQQAAGGGDGEDEQQANGGAQDMVVPSAQASCHFV